jgi:membrane associated rhomboid family serine protease
VQAESRPDRTTGERPWFTGAWLLATVVVTLLPRVSEWAAWTRPSGLDGASTLVTIRAAFTCHLAHYGLAHASWNVLALAITGLLAERTDRCALAGATLLGMVAIPAALAFADPTVLEYRGGSGIASAWFAAALVQAWRSSTSGAMRAWLAVGSVIYVAKLASEAATGSTWFAGHATAEFEGLPLVHWVGTACGALGVAGKRRGGAGEPAPPLLVAVRLAARRRSHAS